MNRMKKRTAVLWLVILILVLGSLGVMSFNVIRQTRATDSKGLKLGLDLAGGVSITYQAKGDTPSSQQMKDTIAKPQSRIENDLGEGQTTTEANVYQVGDNRITVEIPGVKDANAMLAQLGTPGKLYFIKQTGSDGSANYQVSQQTGQYELTKSIEQLQSDGSIVLTGSDVTSSKAGYETQQTGAQKPVVQISLNENGTRAFADATTQAKAKGQSIGIYYDGKFVSVPRVDAAITDGSAVINGMSSDEEADKLATYIRIGGLDIELEELQSEVVGAQLGSNAVSTALLAAGVGLAIVMVFMIALYLLPGLAAAIALALYTVMTVAILYAFNVTLTLPGVAGVILSLGMAVDANAIIFARIREEISAGANVRNAVAAGFHKALGAIIDGNVTTLIAAAVLGLLGSGTVKGFAITLAIGVVLSMFTALLITRLIISIFMALGARDPKAYGKSREWPKINFIGRRWLFIGISLAVICAGVIGLGFHQLSAGKALNYSLEFSGGTSTTVSFDQAYNLQEAQSQIVPVFESVTGDHDVQVQTVQNSKQIIFKTRTLNLEERKSLNEALNQKFGVAESEISSENISSTIGGEMRRAALIAVIVAVFFMLIYIWLRFRDFRFASSAIIALVHDVLIVLTMYAIFRMSVGSAFIACILTVVGYSVNDTIVIFDRHRDNLKTLTDTSNEALAEMANEGVRQTLGRSLSTSFTTAVMVLMLLILGTSTMREFAFPLLVGVISGTYSSIFIATPLWYMMRSHSKIKSADGPARVTANEEKAVRKKKKAQMAKTRR